MRFALAVDPVRVVVYQTYGDDTPTGSAWLTRSRDGGASWPERIELVRYAAEEADGVSVTVDAGLQRADVHFGGDEAPRWLVLDPAGAVGPLTPTRVATPSTQPCVAGTRTWWLGDDDTVYAGEQPGQPLRPVPGSSEGVHSLFCAGDRLIAVTEAGAGGAGQKVLVCRTSGCSATTMPVAPGARSVAAIGERHGPMVATETDGVVVVSGGDPEKKQDFKPIEIARLTGEQELAGMVEWKGAIHLVTRTDKSMHIVPVGK